MELNDAKIHYVFFADGSDVGEGAGGCGGDSPTRAGAGSQLALTFFDHASLYDEDHSSSSFSLRHMGRNYGLPPVLNVSRLRRMFFNAVLLPNIYRHLYQSRVISRSHNSSMADDSKTSLEFVPVGRLRQELCDGEWCGHGSYPSRIVSTIDSAFQSTIEHSH